MAVAHRAFAELKTWLGVKQMIRALRNAMNVVSLVLWVGCGGLEPSQDELEIADDLASSPSNLVVGNQLTTEQIVNASADTFIDSTLPATNVWTTFGSSAFIETRSTSEAWIRFIVPAPPSSAARLTKAELLLLNGCGADSGSVSGGSIARASFANENWSEATASTLLRKNYPPTYGPTLSTLGAVASGTTYTFTGLAPALIGTNGLTRTGPTTFAIRSSSTDSARFCARTNATPPRLKLTYTETLVTGDSSQFVSQVMSTSFLAGEERTVSLSFRNNGTTTWTAAAGFALAPSLNTTWGTAKALLPSTVAVAPGQSRTFSFTVKAPLTYGTYAFQRRMTHGATAFGAVSPATSISVVPGPRCRKVYSKYTSVSLGSGGSCVHNAPITNHDVYLNWTGLDPAACTSSCNGLLSGCTAYISCSATFLPQ